MRAGSSRRVVELVRRDAADRRRIESGRIVDEHVEAPEGLHDLFGEACAGRGVREIRREGARGAGAPGFEAGDEGLGFRARAAIVNRDARAFGMEGGRDYGPDASGGAGDEHGLAGERLAGSGIRLGRGC